MVGGNGGPCYVIPESADKLTGLEWLHEIIEQRLPAPPFTELLGIRIREAEHGYVKFTAEPSAELYNPGGTMHGGWYGAVLDSCMGSAVHSTLPVGSSQATLEYKVNLLRAVTEKTGTVTAEGKVIRAGKRVGVAEGSIYDSRGRILAHGTITCLIFPI